MVERNTAAPLWLLLLLLYYAALFLANEHCAAAAGAQQQQQQQQQQKKQQLKLPTFLASHMVLQREPSQAKIWGWATPGANVTVTLHHHIQQQRHQPGNGDDNDNDDDDDVAAVWTSFGMADQDHGSWIVELDPQPAGTGYSIEITMEHHAKNDTAANTNTNTNRNKTILRLDDVAFGDVYLCSGQSNMEMSVAGVFHARPEIADSKHYPHLRLATARLTAATTPQEDVSSKADSYVWTRSGPHAFYFARSSAGDGSEDTRDDDATFGYYSATCYFFGRELYKSLHGRVPIGLLTSCWGGQRVEAFSSPLALADATCGGTVISNASSIHTSTKNEPTNDSHREENLHQHPHDDSTTAKVHTNGLFGGDYYYNSSSSLGAEPTELWNGMIYPFRHMRLAGVIWYQGESNADNATSYACRFPAMIADWRRQFNLPNLSFFYVELAAYTDNGNNVQTTWPLLRAAQAAALQMPRVGFATAIDLGDLSAPAGAIHPRRKYEVGRRLSLTVRAIQYNETTTALSSSSSLSLIHTGPTLEHVDIFKITPLEYLIVVLTFDPATVALPGLHLHGSADCTACCNESPFEFLFRLDGTTEIAIWERAPFVHMEQVHENELSLIIPCANNNSGLACQNILGVRYAWDSYPQCLLYNGKKIDGGPDDHAGIPAAPFEWCAQPSGQGAWTGNGCLIVGDATTTRTNNTSSVDMQ